MGSLKVLHVFWLSLETLSATAFMLIAGVRVLPNPRFSLGFINILAVVIVRPLSVPVRPVVPLSVVVSPVNVA